MKKDEFYCTVIYPITITKQGLLQHGEITEEQYNNLTEDGNYIMKQAD